MIVPDANVLIFAHVVAARPRSGVRPAAEPLFPRSG
jgi:hypothetical protein